MILLEAQPSGLEAYFIEILLAAIGGILTALVFIYKQSRSDAKEAQKREDARRDAEVELLKGRIKEEKEANQRKEKSFDDLKQRITAALDRVGDLSELLRATIGDVTEVRGDVTEVRGRVARIENHIWPKDQNKIK